MVTSVSASIVIESVTPSQVFDHLCNPANHAAGDATGHVIGPIGTDHITGKGDRFGMRMRWGLPYRVTNTVVDYERDARVAWRHFAGHRWRYELVAVDGGTEVTETFDLSHVATIAHPVYVGFFGFPDRYRASLAASLADLRDMLTR